MQESAAVRAVSTEIKPARKIEEPKGLLHSWHANLIVLQRRQCVLMTHDETRYPVFLGPMTKPDFKFFDRSFAFALMNALLKSGADEMQMEIASSQIQKLYFDTCTNRSVLATMNVATKDLEVLIEHERSKIEDLNEHRISAWLADRPCTVDRGKRILWPKQAMFDLLNTLR